MGRRPVVDDIRVVALTRGNEEAVCRSAVRLFHPRAGDEHARGVRTRLGVEAPDADVLLTDEQQAVGVVGHAAFLLRIDPQLPGQLGPHAACAVVRQPPLLDEARLVRRDGEEVAGPGAVVEADAGGLDLRRRVDRRFRDIEKLSGGGVELEQIDARPARAAGPDNDAVPAADGDAAADVHVVGAAGLPLRNSLAVQPEHAQALPLVGPDDQAVRRVHGIDPHGRIVRRVAPRAFRCRLGRGRNHHQVVRPYSEVFRDQVLLHPAIDGVLHRRALPRQPRRHGQHQQRAGRKATDAKQRIARDGHRIRPVSFTPPSVVSRCRRRAGRRRGMPPGRASKGVSACGVM